MCFFYYGTVYFILFAVMVCCVLREVLHMLCTKSISGDYFINIVALTTEYIRCFWLSAYYVVTLAKVKSPRRGALRKLLIFNHLK